MKISRKVFALFLLSLLAIILTASLTLQAEEILPAADWPMFRHDPRHSGSNSCGAPVTGSVLWQTNVGLPIYSSPAIVDGKVFFGVRDQLLALDSHNGKTIWKAPMVGEIYSSPAVDPKAGLVYIASYGSRSSTLSAFDMRTGNRCWWTWMTTKSSPTVVQNPPILISSLIYPPIPRATVYIGYGYDLLAFDADTGKQLWSFRGEGVIESTPAVDEQNVYFGTNGNRVYAVNRFSGKLFWMFDPKGAVISSPSVSDKYVVFGDTAGYVHFLDKKIGFPHRYYIAPGPITSSPALIPASSDPSEANTGALYIASSVSPDSNSGSLLFKFTEDGLPIWKAPVPGEVHSSPAVAAGRVYIGSQGSRSSAIFCFNGANGAQLWYDKWMMMYSSPSIANHFLYVTTLDGMVYCLIDWL
jgi:outer membrane protein assembly factor BamB